MEYKTVKLGDYIELVPQSGGQGLGLDRIRGISIEKKVIATKANMSGVDISGYNVVGSGEFVYATNTARMGDKIAVAYNHDEPILV